MPKAPPPPPPLNLDSLVDFHAKLIRLTKEFELQLDHDKHIPIEKRKATT